MIAAIDLRWTEKKREAKEEQTYNVHFSGILLYVHRLPHASFCFTKVLSDALDSSGCLGNSCCYQKMYFLRAEKIGMTGRFAKTALRLFERTRNPLV